MECVSMRRKRMEYYRHGDVFIVKVDKIPGAAKKTTERVLEYGEVTGHAHRLHGDADASIVYQTKNGAKYLRVIRPTDLKHEEHDTRVIPPGDYEIRRTRETDH